MRRYLVVALFVSTPLWAQQIPTPDEQAFARLPADLQALLGNLPARAALQKLDYARQNLIATGNAGYSPDQLRAGVETVLDPHYAAVRSISAGAGSFPPLSPLVPANAFDYRCLGAGFCGGVVTGGDGGVSRARESVLLPVPASRSCFRQSSRKVPVRSSHFALPGTPAVSPGRMAPPLMAPSAGRLPSWLVPGGMEPRSPVWGRTGPASVHALMTRTIRNTFSRLIALTEANSMPCRSARRPRPAGRARF